MIVESDGSSAAVRVSDGPELAEVAIELRPEFVCLAVTYVSAIVGLGRIVGRIMLGEILDDVELDVWVVRESVESEI
jgi:hypothetical protein